MNKCINYKDYSNVDPLKKYQTFACTNSSLYSLNDQNYSERKIFLYKTNYYLICIIVSPLKSHFLINLPCGGH